MKTSLTDFQRNFRKAREAADLGRTVVVQGEHGEYIFERRTRALLNPFDGLEEVFGAITLPQSKGDLREKVRSRIGAKNRGRGRGAT